MSDGLPVGGEEGVEVSFEGHTGVGWALGQCGWGKGASGVGFQGIGGGDDVRYGKYRSCVKVTGVLGVE